MTRQPKVLYSFALKLGAERICWTAWQQVLGLRDAGADVTAMVGCLARPMPAGVRVKTTLSAGPLRVPYSIVGIQRAFAIHDLLVARWLEKHWREVDVVHAWPLGAMKTFEVARRHGIPTLLERQNCHSLYAYRIVDEECRRLGVVLPEGYEHVYDPIALARELREYEAADFLLCPSDFVRKTFIHEEFNDAKLLRHRYGYDAARISPGEQRPLDGRPLVTLFAGLCSPRKGLHHALHAWLDSPLSKNGGRFLVCGEFADAYRDRLADLLVRPGVEVLGHRTDLPDLMKQADLFVLPSLEEGSALVTYEARGAGCVLIVSDAAGAVCEHRTDGMIHAAGNAAELSAHFAEVDRDRQFLHQLRARSIDGLDGLTWRSAGRRLADVYREAIASPRSNTPRS